MANKMKWARWLLVLAGLPGVWNLHTLETVTQSLLIRRRDLGISRIGTLKRIEENAEQAFLRKVKKPTSAKPADKQKLGPEKGKPAAP